MVIHISSFTFSGVDIIDVDVQVQIVSGMPAFTIVGLADKTIGESRERVKAALSSIGLALPAKRILVNLAPADLLKEGSHFDLPIACGVLTSMGVLPAEDMCQYLVGGELSLDGSIQAISGILPAAIGATQRGKGLICPYANGKEAAWSGNEGVIAPSNLIALVNHFKGTHILNRPEATLDSSRAIYADMSDIIGQEAAKRVLEIAASGEHNLIMSGPPGAGKSMLAQRLPGLLPEMSAREILECSAISSIAGLIEDGKLTSSRPFRAPHHTSSQAAMVGGGVGKKVKPGEISLAHNGVLFLDELPEFPPNVIESLRQPIENGKVLISRANSHITYPAKFQLIAAMNPCKCGYLGDNTRSCTRAPKCGIDYQNRVSGPIMDRFDLSIEVPAMDFNSLHEPKNMKETSEQIKERVARARQIQLERYDGCGITTNARLDGQLLIDHAMPVDGSIELLNSAANKFKLSMRAYNRILRVARTIADLEAAKNVRRIHIAEALNYRQLGYVQNG
jgi:magnesium chelatase family protein